MFIDWTFCIRTKIIILLEPGHDTMHLQARCTVRKNREIKHMVFYTVQIGVYRLFNCSGITKHL